MKDRTHLSIRMNNEMHDKLKYIAKYEGRSMSSQILQLIKTCIRDFEHEHGPISPEDMEP